MRRRLTCLMLLFVLALASCASPVEISLTTRATIYQGRIFIGGAVNNPGLYPYNTGDSLAELIRIAGGLRDGADTSQVELSFSADSAPQKIDLNRAEAWLLAALPGIGEATAQDIVSYRAESGPFQSVSDLLKVKGVGEATLNQIKDYVTVGGR